MTPGARPIAADVAVDRPALLGEGPVWDARRGELLTVDIERGHVHFDRPDWGESVTVEVGDVVGAVHLRAPEGYVLTTRDGLAVLDAARSAIAELAALDPSLGTRMNDAACDARGRLWAGSMALDEASAVGSLYRVDPGAPPVRVLEGVTISNGIGFSPDARTMYYVDSASGGIDAFAYDLDAGTISSRRRLVDLDRGTPDGLTVDADGCIWVALWGGGAVRRYTPAGELDREIPLPVSQVTSCCFGGEGLDRLFITTAARGLEAPERYAGSIFVCDAGVQGLPPAAYGG